MTSRDLTTLTPQELDTELAANYEAHRAARQSHAFALDSLHHAANDRKNYTGRGRQSAWGMTDAAALAAATATAADETAMAYRREEAAKALAKLADVEATLKGLAAEAAPLHAEYARRPWPRFFLVEHVHSSTSCHTLRPTTKYAWLPTLSGMTEADAVAAHGALLCTHCYPTAPVEWTNGHDLAAQERKASQCPGAGKYVETVARVGMRWYGDCPDCGGRVLKTDTGKLRAHKPPKK